MRLPRLPEIQNNTEMIQSFGGYNHRDRIGENEFYDMANLTSDRYPLMANRGIRGSVVPESIFTGTSLCGKDRLWYIEDATIVGIDPFTGEKVVALTGVQHTPKFVSFGSYLIDMQNYIWLDTIEKDGQYEHGVFGISINRNSGYFSTYICDQDGEPIQCDVSDKAPEDVPDGSLWLSLEQSPSVLYKWYEYNKSWFPEQYYVRVVYNPLEYEDNPIQKGDAVRFDSPELSVVEKYEEKPTMICRLDTEENMSYIVEKSGILDSGKHYIVLKCGICNTAGFTIDDNGNGEIDETGTVEITVKKQSFSIRNEIPALDFVVESNNRLWGCRYGLDNDGNFVNEIYASKLGSFRSWEKFEGISDDSYRVSCGTDGPFTGATTYGGNPIFFKEDYMHRVYGSFPFQVTPIQCNGVQKGCGDSLAMVDNVLYYKSPNGICTYTGSYPNLLSLPFGDEKYNAVIGAGTDTKYYFSTDKCVFVYDTTTKLLTKESLPTDDEVYEIESMVTCQSEVFAVMSESSRRGIICLSNRNTCNGWYERNVSWFGVFGEIGLNLPNQKYVTSLDIRMDLATSGTMSIFFEYDSSGTWELVHEVQGESLKTFNIPLRVKRCDHLRMKLEGAGNFTLYSITKTIEGGSMKCK